MGAIFRNLMLIFITSLSVCGRAQDTQSVKKSVLAAIERIENFPAVVIKGKLKNFGSEASAVLHVRGDFVWQEEHQRVLAEKQNEINNELVAARGITKCDLPMILAFDGQKAYEFSPFRLQLRVELSPSAPAGVLAILPRDWLTMSGSRNQPLKKLVEGKTAEVKVESITDGRWRLSQTGLGDNLPEASRKRVGIRERSIIVDPKLDFNITEYDGSGAQGNLKGEFEWEKQDGVWFIKHGKRVANGRIVSEWGIDEISFDAKKCRTRFDDLETIVPFATCINVYDGNRKLVTERFKGGKEGEEEYKLIKLALVKGRISGD